MPEVIWTPRAREDLEQIVYYIRVSAERPFTAQRIAEEIVREAEKLATVAESGPRHPAAPDFWRYFRHKRWLIFYKPIPIGVEIMRVIDGSRDLPKALAEFPVRG
jgi:toxin ParE1/3/4